ncbi:hypothetical protein CcaverHIS002_0104190 [Cutaneotrichosporon cavernicola]|uniref:Uncharacterized protein n=1 Tax=Cutaneotrichosporon cavernicola TaxID=279322 RepID=A0AA48KWZ2_9TREE|nr:uncharacterized protein CcaverHIS019_0104120 [Cutaneotrichosporon cavernicola]BEI79890.1 hypothetical protein CcaverHIS002_0104190 [Cutaneotrichosporon cavernicola]BEI87694.1 hypothetical protein CcaverHIS019_0104120 [Cutaneotrichosporon cavernicola]BEI95466.1 hypothetical protein CcaverHIS631_0104150 [Cutaneotrichosporon cavernicola]BEJ03240.1 hypothetical protein CcaverHIS641_0104150 [Cutaneotrichosporon cavernicola]
MTVVAPVLDKSDPKTDKLYPYHLPFSEDWSEKKEIFGSSTMMMAGGGMFMRNPLIIWTAAVLGVQSFVTQEPLRAPKDANSPLATLGMALSGIIATTLPKMMLAPETQAATTA